MERRIAELVHDNLIKYDKHPITISDIMDNMVKLMIDGPYDVYGMDKGGITYLAWVPQNESNTNVRTQTMPSF